MAASAVRNINPDGESMDGSDFDFAYVSGVYRITNMKNGRSYVGSSVVLKKRLSEHCRQLSANRHHSSFLQRCWNKNRPSDFKFEVLAYCRPEDVLMYEQLFMDALSPEYNTSPVAGSQFGYRHTIETRKKMSRSRRKDFSPFTGKSHTDETKLKISESRKGKGATGWTDERRRKISEALKGRIITQEARDKISETLRGHKQSRETIEKRSKKLLGRKMSEEFKKNASERMKGVRMPQDSIDKMARSLSRFTEKQVRDLRSLLSEGMSQKEASEISGIPRHTVADISCGRKYGWVK